MDLGFRTELLQLVEIKPKSQPNSSQFIVEVASQFRDENYTLVESLLDLDPNFVRLVPQLGSADKGPIEAYVRKLGKGSKGGAILELFERMGQWQNHIRSLEEKALTSFDRTTDLALFLFLTDWLSNPLLFDENFDWIKKGFDRFGQSGLLRYLFGFVAGTGLAYGRVMNIDPSDLIFGSLFLDSASVIDAYEAYVAITAASLKNHPGLLKSQYESGGKTLLPGVPLESYRDAYESLLLCYLADFYSLVGNYQKVQNTITQAFSLRPDFCYALALRGNLLTYAKSVSGESDLTRAIELTDSQLIEPLRGKIKASSLIGLGSSYLNRGLYEKAETLCNEALRASPDPSMQSIALLNRGRARLENDKLAGAAEDFIVASKSRILAPLAHTNLGIVYMKQGLYEKSQSELLHAIDINPNYAPAFYNLAILFNNEGKKDRVRKLFQTTLQIDPNFVEARTALTKLDAHEDHTTDWWGWWFSSKTSRWKTAVGVASIVLLFLVVGRLTIYAVIGLDVPTANFGVVALIILILILPSVRKLAAGGVSIELGPESVGQKPFAATTVAPAEYKLV